jgi:hypothetical protein
MSKSNVIDDLNMGVSSFDAISNQLNYLMDNLNKLSSSELSEALMGLKFCSQSTKEHFELILDKLEKFKKNGFQ